MTRPDDIPQDVWDRACTTWLDEGMMTCGKPNGPRVIARIYMAALAEEREACDRVAMEFGARMGKFIRRDRSDSQNAPFESAQGAAHEIAAAIRKRGEG